METCDKWELKINIRKKEYLISLNADRVLEDIRNVSNTFDLSFIMINHAKHT